MEKSQKHGADEMCSAEAGPQLQEEAAPPDNFTSAALTCVERRGESRTGPTRTNPARF